MSALQPLPPTPGPKLYLHPKVKLIRVVDGDTVLLDFPQDFNQHSDINMRLICMNAPEIRGPNHVAAVAATGYLSGLMAGAEGLIAQTHKKDKYGRWLGELWVLRPGGWLNVSVAMLAAGHAIPYLPK